MNEMCKKNNVSENFSKSVKKRLIELATRLKAKIWNWLCWLRFKAKIWNRLYWLHFKAKIWNRLCWLRFHLLKFKIKHANLLVILKKRLIEPATRFKAKIWNWLYWLRFHLLRFKIKHANLLIILIFSVLIGLSLYFAPALQKSLEPYFSSGNRLSVLETVFITLGGALVGAGAISFSLVMFALQINIERMPHGLFWRFTSDKKVIFAFTAIFFLATGIASSSLFIGLQNVAICILSACWSAILIISLVIYAYRRTLILINPIKQLTKIIDDTRKELRVWGRRAERARPLLKSKEEDSNKEEDSQFGTTHDTALAAYFQLNPHWTAEPTKAIDYAISFSRRYAESGDYTVSRNALDVIVGINAIYIQTKGKTFFSDSLLMRNPLSTDGFINSTLEQLRQTLSIGLSRKDEQQIEQTIHAFTC